MHGDWVVGIDHNCYIPIPADELCVQETFDNPTAFSLIDTQDVEDKEDALTVVRIVGDLPMHAFVKDLNVGEALDVITVREGIYLSTVDPAGVVIDMDPRLPGDMESDCWLYLRTRAFKFAAVNTAGSSQPAVFWQSGADYSGNQSDHLDLRVKRKVKRGQELVYCVGAYHESLLAGSFVTHQAVMQGHLRVYVKY